MSISIKVLTFALISVSFAYEEEVPSRDSQALHFFSSKETQEDSGYAEQCRDTNLKKEYLGHVNVFAFLDPFWNYSYRQAIMLKLLKKRLEKSGLRDILFFAVAPPSGLPEDDAENEIEIRAWKEIAKNLLAQEYFWVAEEAPYNELEGNNDNGIILLRDTPELRIWERFRVSKDEVLIVDRCGKLTYQVIVPWSILYFPYVKAAILSTYKSDPCGPCDINLSEKQVDENLVFHTEQVLTIVESENAAISSGELKETETSTIVSSDASVTTVETPIFSSTVTDTLSMETGTIRTDSTFGETYELHGTMSTEDLKKDENMNIIFSIDRNETTAKVPLKQEQTEASPTFSGSESIEDFKDAQDCTSSNDPASVNNNNSAPAIPNVNTTKTSIQESDQNALDTNLKGLKEEEEISSVDQAALNENIENKENRSQVEESLPLRIIMYDPHSHKGEHSKQYTHSILKTGSPDYHKHFHSMTNVHDQQRMPSEMTSENRKVDKHIDGGNEKPGIYGEIYDYWKVAEEDELNYQNENTGFVDYDNVAVEDPENNAFGNQNTIFKPSDTDLTDSDTKSDEDSDDSAQRKQIEHYNKLVPWIYYML